MTGWFHSAGASAELISIERFVDDRIFVTRSGAYGATFQLNGVDPECLSDPELENVSTRLVHTMRLLPDDCTLQQILIKRRGAELEHSRYACSDNEVVVSTEHERRVHLKERGLSSVGLYWTVCIRQPNSRRPQKPTDQSKVSARLLHRLRETLGVLEQNISDLTGIERLDCDGIGRLYGYIANLDSALTPQRLRSRHRVATQIARTSVEWKRDGLQIGRRHARLFSLIQRPGSTRPHLYGDLTKLQADLILVLEVERRSAIETRKCVAGHQTFKDLFRHSVLSVLAHAKSGREISKSANTVAADKGVDDLGGVIDDIENRGLNYCEASLIGLLHSASTDELDEQMAQVHRVFSQSETGVIDEGLGALAAYHAMFPAAVCGTKSPNVRRWWIREDHLANLSLVYAPYTGEQRSDTLEDEALAIFETRSGTPFYFDPYSNGVRGMLVTGSPGRGKSFRLNFEVDMQAKYGGFIFVFDIGRSFEQTVLKHGGSIVNFGLDGPRVNPFALPPTDQNIDFIHRLVRLLLTKSGAVLAPTQETDLYRRVKSMYALSPEVRRLKHMVLSPELQPYLARWVEGGIYGRIFDNVDDDLRFSRIAVFEFQEVAGEEHRDLMEPLLFWLRWQTQSITHDPAHLGVPKLEIYDECWKHMQDPAMVAMIINTAKTARKHLGGIILATQDAGDVGEHANLVRNACSDTLFLGGPFSREAYRELFKLHDRQLDLIAGLQMGESLLVRADYSKVLITNVGAETAWHYTTRAKDRKRREEAIQRFGREHAFAHLAGNGNSHKQGAKT